MPYRLLVDLEVILFLETLSKGQRRVLLAHFRKIQNYQAASSDFTEQDELGRRLHVSLLDGLAIYFWIDDADKHVKILKIIAAD